MRESKCQIIMVLVIIIIYQRLFKVFLVVFCLFVFAKALKRKSDTCVNLAMIREGKFLVYILYYLFSDGGRKKVIAGYQFEK